MRPHPANALCSRRQVYRYVTEELRSGNPLRLMVQASAGTGKSFLLETLFLWCLCEKLKTKAVAPTGIAAANIGIEGCDVSACTLHYAFDLDGQTKSKLDFAKVSNTKVAEIMTLDVLFMDEVGV